MNLELQSTFRTDKSEQVSLVEESNEKENKRKCLKIENNNHKDVVRNNPG